MTGDVGRVWTALLCLQRLSWEQGVASHAALDHGRDDVAMLIAEDAVVRQDELGRLGEIDGAGLVNCGALVEVVAWAATRTGDPEMSAALERQLAWLDHGCPRAADGTLYHLVGSEQMWTDSVYMLVPALVAARRPAAALAQLEGHRSRLFDESAGLYAARWDEPSRTLVAPGAWGTANGWVAAGLARAVHLDAAADGTLLDDEARASLTSHARAVIEGCLKHRRPDGLFHDVLDDPRTHVEANLAQMLAFAIGSGARDGWLPASSALLAADLREAGARGLDRLGVVRGVTGSPHFDRVGRSAEAQAFYLLAAAV